jgi:hypothetical protein
MTGKLTTGDHLWQPNGFTMALIRQAGPVCPKINRKPQDLRQKCHNPRTAARDKHLSTGIITEFGDNASNGIVAFGVRG